MKNTFAAIMLLSLNAFAQEVIKYDFKGVDGNKESLEAVVRIPKVDAKNKAVIILHHWGGWGAGDTAQYAEYFSKNGYVTLEPRLFNYRVRSALPFLAPTFGALSYLSSHPSVDKDNIFLMGLSFGGILTIFSATDWANKQFGDGVNRFKSFAPLYPVCWLHTKMIKRQFQHTYPKDFEDKWVESPMKIFAGSQDDYDDRDPNACNEFIESIPDPKQKAVTSVQVYAGATHGWDQTSRSFNEPVFGCKGRGCMNTNSNNPTVTARAKEDLLTFFNEGK